jgi:hypothetical protein
MQPAARRACYRKLPFGVNGFVQEDGNGTPPAQAAGPAWLRVAGLPEKDYRNPGIHASFFRFPETGAVVSAEGRIFLRVSGVCIE